METKRILVKHPVKQKVFDSVEQSHQGLGMLSLVEILADMSNRAMLIIGSSGTGKSTAMNFLKKTCQRNVMSLDAITVSGLRYIAPRLFNANLTILVDDLSKGGTEYSQVATAMVLGELVYSGFVAKLTSNLNLQIYDFKGSAIMNAQPLILARLLRESEFETDIRDKVIRYYHIYMPLEPKQAIPQNGITYSYDYKSVEIPEKVLKSKLYHEGQTLFQYEFSKARAKEHYEALIRASALLESRKTVELEDLEFINKAFSTFRIEIELFDKKQLEGARRLNVNILPLLSVLATYQTPTVEQMCQIFQVKERRLYEIIQTLGEFVITKQKRIFLTKEGVDLLKRIGVNHANTSDID